MQKIIELYGGPGSGKSTLAANLFADLKFAGYNVELVREYAKELVWRHGKITVSQEEILFEQAVRQHDLYGKVDLIVTDSPLLMAAVYGSSLQTIQHNMLPYKSLPVFVNRVKPYNQAGREQTEEEAKEKDKEIRMLLPKDCIRVSGDLPGAIELCKIATMFINEGKE